MASTEDAPFPNNPAAGSVYAVVPDLKPPAPPDEVTPLEFLNRPSPKVNGTALPKSSAVEGFNPAEPKRPGLAAGFAAIDGSRPASVFRRSGTAILHSEGSYSSRTAATAALFEH